ncbi:phage tail tube protein [Mesorhizobium sp. B2-4-6]|uniref:phage tail tube protein n=1 Tax=Mesorhizobium sp. B2-4-6 TaxID=2589943 RepID=UPI00112B0443|nr:phage tail tube protein [Mesorhizobium sp. B2-4-6]TPL40695.1 hypothetical protein FJ957_26045 [Mesorhizobium sp. B2-4-6]
MAYSENFNGYTAYKVQSGLGVQASGADAKVLRQTGGNGTRMTKANTESKEVRRDGLSTRGRHGIQNVSGAFTHELSVGGYDDILEAVIRGTWSAADLQIDESDFTSITTGANTIVLAAGSPITLGLKVNNIIRLTNHSSAGNNNRNLRITGLSSTTITVAETLTVNAVADTDCEITRPGRVLINPGAGNLVKRYFTVEEHEYDLDRSELSTDCSWSSFKLTMAPNGLIDFETALAGTGQFDALDTASSPFFTSPVTSTGDPLAVVEATIRMGGVDIVDLTSFDLMVDCQTQAPPVITKATSPYAPALFTGTELVTMNLTMLRKDMQLLADFIDETPFSLHVLLAENEAEPASFISFAVPNFTLGSVDKSGLTKQGGPRTQTIAIPPALIGIDNTGAGYDATAVAIQVSNAT